jgi:hypothetical protein
LRIALHTSVEEKRTREEKRESLNSFTHCIQAEIKTQTAHKQIELDIYHNSRLTDGNSHTKDIHDHLNGGGAVCRINIYTIHHQRQHSSEYDTNKYNEEETRRDRYRLRDGSKKDGGS